MRTTLSTDDDVPLAAKAIAHASHLATTALKPGKAAPHLIASK